MNNSEISYVAIALLLEKKIEKQIINLSEKLYNKYNSRWVLSVNDFPPHVTLWLAYMPKKNEELLISEVEGIIDKTKCFSIELDKIEIKDSNKEYYICQEIKQTDELSKIHFYLLNKLNYIREGYIHNKYLDILSNIANENIKFNIENFGTRFVGQLFNPHLSISFIDKEKISRDELEIELNKLFEGGNHKLYMNRPNRELLPNYLGF